MCNIIDKYEARGEQRGISIGEQRGKQQQARETALRLFQMGMPLSQIADIVRFDSREVAGWLPKA